MITRWGWAAGGAGPAATTARLTTRATRGRVWPRRGGFKAKDPFWCWRLRASISSYAQTNTSRAAGILRHRTRFRQPHILQILQTARGLRRDPAAPAEPAAILSAHGPSGPRRRRGRRRQG